MNKYHIIFYFSDKANIETDIDSKLDLKKFTKKFTNLVADTNKFICLAGVPKKTIININNVLFYTIDKIQESDK